MNTLFNLQQQQPQGPSPLLLLTPKSARMPTARLCRFGGEEGAYTWRHKSRGRDPGSESSGDGGCWEQKRAKRG
ncbi:hypothetical protein V6Z12_D10G235100 [Gossypium hirsutum]